MNHQAAYSLYYHFPFCRKKCRYCDFYSVSYEHSAVDRFLRALKQEWSLRRNKHNLDTVAVSTIYCGGGTPSMLTPDQWRTFCAECIPYANLTKDIEWTIECNPDSFTPQKAQAWKETGVTRITFGIQSLHDRELRVLGRSHTARKVLQVLAHPLLKQFKSVGGDCMYGIPGQTSDSLNETLQQILELEIITHLSAYELTIAEKTPFARHRPLLCLPDEDTRAAMTTQILNCMRQYRFEQYEVSNYCKEGYECNHNERYWTHETYIGLGPSAHSYMHPHRFANTGDVQRYIGLLGNGSLPVAFSECLGSQAYARELIFLGLRTRRGVNEKTFFRETKEVFFSGRRKKILQQLCASHYLEYVRPFWRLTDTGMLYADAIAEKLF